MTPVLIAEHQLACGRRAFHWLGPTVVMFVVLLLVVQSPISQTYSRHPVEERGSEAPDAESPDAVRQQSVLPFRALHRAPKSTAMPKSRSPEETVTKRRTFIATLTSLPSHTSHITSKQSINDDARLKQRELRELNKKLLLLQFENEQLRRQEATQKTDEPNSDHSENTYAYVSPASGGAAGYILLGRIFNRE